MTGGFSLPASKRNARPLQRVKGSYSQVAIEKIILLPVSDDYFTNESGLGSKHSAYIFLMPVIYEGKIYAMIIELFAADELVEEHQAFLNDASGIIAIAILLPRQKSCSKIVGKNHRSRRRMHFKNNRRIYVQPMKSWNIRQMF